MVVPYAGPAGGLDEVVERLAALARQPGDTVTVADNRPGARAFERGPVRVVAARDFRGSYHARNRGAEDGAADWLLFIDADVTPRSDLLDRLFEPPPSETTAVLAGAVVDEAPSARGWSGAQRYAWLKSSMSQEHTLSSGTAAFAQTANCAVRRDAFVAVGGFVDWVRSGGDADLCLRLRAAGWELESRPHAVVTHRNRSTLRGLLAQRARHGAGAAWVASRHPGALPARSLPGVTWWALRRLAAGALALVRGDRDRALVAMIDGPAVLAFEIGRRLPNRRVLQPLRSGTAPSEP